MNILGLEIEPEVIPILITIIIIITIATIGAILCNGAACLYK